MTRYSEVTVTTDVPLTVVSAFDAAVMVTVPVTNPGVTTPFALTDAIAAFDEDHTTDRSVTSHPASTDAARCTCSPLFTVALSGLTTTLRTVESRGSACGGNGSFSPHASAPTETLANTITNTATRFIRLLLRGVAGTNTIVGDTMAILEC
jgi:hypothetical protein